MRLLSPVFFFFILFQCWWMCSSKSSPPSSSNSFPIIHMVVDDLGFFSSKDFVYAATLKEGGHSLHYGSSVARIPKSPNNQTFQTVLSTVGSNRSSFYFAVGLSGENQSLFTLGRCDLDGSNVRILSQTASPLHAIQALHGGSLAMITSSGSLVVFSTTDGNTTAVGTGGPLSVLAADPNHPTLYQIDSDKLLVYDTSNVSNVTLKRSVSLSKFFKGYAYVDTMAYNALYDALYIILDNGDVARLSLGNQVEFHLLASLGNVFQPIIAFPPSYTSMYIAAPTVGVDSETLLYHMNATNGAVKGKEEIFEGFLHLVDPSIHTMVVE